MPNISTSELLDIWEEGLGQPLVEKTIRLLSKVYSPADPEFVKQLSIGERDRWLLQIREWMFGHRLKNMTKCPTCSESIEWESGTDDLHVQPSPSGISPRTFSFVKDNFIIRYRLPNSNDMLRFVSAGTNHRMLLANCILEIQSGEVQSLAKDLPESVWDELDHQMEQKDPQADIRMKIKCPACLTDFEAGFDIMNFLWAEINDWAHRILQEVYLLARSYGWSEKDILSMSSRRRHAYREMLRP